MDLKLPLLLALLVGGAVGLLWPMAEPGADLASPAAQVAEREAAPAAQLATAQEVPDDWADDTMIPRSADGHYYADVEIAGQQVRMLVDTGASVVALTGADAEQLGILWDDADIAIVAQGASGGVRGVRTTIPKIMLGDHVAMNIPAVIIPEGLQVSLLGQAFLGTFGHVQMRGGEMVLGNDAR